MSLVALVGVAGKTESDVLGVIGDIPKPGVGGISSSWPPSWWKGTGFSKRALSLVASGGGDGQGEADLRKEQYVQYHSGTERK